MGETRRKLDAPLLLNRYRPRVLLARGGSAQVYQGIDETLGRQVAIKVFAAGVDVEKYRDELRVLAGLSHHGVVSIVDAGIDLSTPSDPRPFLVMELVRGTTVRDALRQNPFTVQRVGEIGYEVAEALDYVHSQGVIHRDVSPANIMLTDYGTVSSRPRARLTDFGIAIDVAYAPAPAEAITGTVAYLSPEQVRNVPLGPETDIYALGLVMLECFTDTVAFPGPHIPSALARLDTDPVISKDIPKDWRRLIGRMTQQEPLERPTAAEVADEVRRILRKMR